MLEIYEMPGHLVRRLNQASVSVFMEEASKKGFDLTPVQYAALSHRGWTRSRPGNARQPYRL